MNAPRSHVVLKNRLLAAFLAWFFPGLGHFYQGRTGKAILFLVAIFGLFLLGIVMSEGHVVFWRWVNPMTQSEAFRFAYLFQFWTGLPSLMGLIQGTLAYNGIAPILGGFQAEPSIEEFNIIQEKLGKLIEVGTFYTAVAGLLNLLAILDAHGGPAFPDLVETDSNDAKADTETEKPQSRDNQPESDHA